MHCTLKSLVLATLALGQAYAATVSHAHAHMHASNRRHDHVEKRASALSSAGSALLTSLGAQLGQNAVADNGHAWLGQDGQYKNEFINNSGEDIQLVVWGVAGSWVNAVPPSITATIPNNGSLWVSFASGASGAWAGAYPDTKLVNGQLHATWGEFTFGEWGVVDVSREVNMEGHGMSIVGPNCVSDMDTCVFVCPAGQLVCTYGYILQNCENGSQRGANYGTYAGSPSGGCGGMGAAASLTTYLW